MEGSQKIGQSLNSRFIQIEDMKESITRYLQDIDNNYIDIIEALSFEQFQEIMDRYNEKINHFESRVH